MRTLLIAINSKYIHPGYGVYQIVANANTKPDFFEFTIKDDIDNIINKIINYDADLLAFSCYIWNIEIIKAILNHLKQINYSSPILLGGPEVSYQSEFFFRNYNIDYIIKNEGEKAYNQLLLYLEGKIEINKVSNLYYFKGNQVHFTYNELPDITQINSAHHLVKDPNNQIIYFESSRGCCFNCSYCMASLEPSIRLVPIEKVKHDLKNLLDKKVKTIKFLDRSFNVYINHALEILKFFTENDNHYTTVQFEVVGDILDERIIDYILKNVRKNYFRFEIGIQSTNPITTKAVNRVQNFKKLQENISKLKDKVTLHLDLIAGLPYENKESFISTFNDTFLLFPHELQLGFLKELKGTLISIEKTKHGYVFDNLAPYEVIENNYISKKDLDEIRIVEEMLNRLYNNNLFTTTIKHLILEMNLNPYQLFLAIGLHFINKNIDYKRCQIHDLFIGVYDYLENTYPSKSEQLLFLLKQDYLKHFKIRPKIWWKSSTSKEEKLQVFQKLLSIDEGLTLDILYRYCRIETFKDQAFAVLYLQDKTIYHTFTF